MAKRGAVQLQTELENDEDFENFLLNPGLLVIDVHAEWCGPCSAMVSTLKRIKLDVGSDLTLAVAKCDTISYLQRFYKKSEPTWLFITGNEVVNLMFGTNPARLRTLIYEELGNLGKFQSRKRFRLDELLPEEEQRLKMKNDLINFKRHSEIADLEREKYEHFKYVTDLIREHLPEMGVIIFGPHIGRDLVFKSVEFARNFRIQIKDRRTQVIAKEKFQEINYLCKNPLSEDIIDAIAGKEFIVSLWRVPEKSDQQVVMELLNFANILTKPHTSRGHSTEHINGPYIGPNKIQVEFELRDPQDCPNGPDVECEDVILRSVDKAKSLEDNISIYGSEEEDEMGSEEVEAMPEEKKQEPLLFLGYSSVESLEEQENISEERYRTSICRKTVTVPGLWIPEDSRIHAALIYHLFRAHTATFLPPDPVPEPPHVVMAFHTYKQRDLLDFASRYKDDIPAYGYFTSDDVDEAKFIANSKQKYAHHHPHSVADKLVFKVNKQTSNTMLSLVGYGPTYVSLNTEVGEKEAQKFFPPDYVTADEELRKLAEAEKERLSFLSKKTKALRRSLKSELTHVKESTSSDYDDDENLFGEEEEYMHWLREHGFEIPNKTGHNTFGEEVEGEVEVEEISKGSMSAPENEENQSISHLKEVV